VVRRALSGLATQEGNEQREAIFHKRCTMGDKVCSFIIDGESCRNVTSKTLVEELKLTASPQPSPYNHPMAQSRKRYPSFFLLFGFFKHWEKATKMKFVVM